MIKTLFNRKAASLDTKGLVVDGDRIIIHGIGLTEAWVDETKQAIYYRVAHIWKALECVIPNGDLIYAFQRTGFGLKVDGAPNEEAVAATSDLVSVGR